MPSNDSSHLTHTKYRADIDGLRAIAVLSVLGFHGLYPGVRGGFIGVDIFFVISGFLISAIIFSSLERDAFSFAEFYSRRIRRIFPALLIVLSACFAFGWFVLLAEEYQQLGKHIAGSAGFISNFILWNESGYFDNASETKPLLHLWSLGIEEQFYIIWPLLLWMTWKYRLNLLTLTISLAALSFAINIFYYRNDAIALFYSPQTRFWELLSGSILAHITLYNPTSISNAKAKLCGWLNRVFFANSPKANKKTLDNVQSVLGAILITLGLLVIRIEKHFPGFWAVLPVLGAVLIIAAGTHAWLNRVVLSNRILVWFGLISYPLYLWHWPIFSFVHIVEIEAKFRGIRVAATLISIVLAWMTYKLIEMPIRFGNLARLKTVSMLALMIITGLVGYTTYHKNGLEFRQFAKLTKNISDAKKDWGYGSTTLIDGKIENLKIFQGQVDERVLFVGDSIMGQYYPRLAKIYSEIPKPYYSTVFAARNHCQPVPGYDLISPPEKINCIEYYNVAMELAKDENFKKIVLAGNWIDLAPENKLGEQGAHLIQDIKLLKTLGKEVIIITIHPRSAQFDPKNIIKPLRKRLFTTVDDYSIDRKVIESYDAPQNRSLRLISEQSGASLINPFDYFCTKNECPITIDGEALYIDPDHIRAKHSRLRATFMDEIVNDLMGGF